MINKDKLNAELVQKFNDNIPDSTSNVVKVVAQAGFLLEEIEAIAQCLDLIRTEVSLMQINAELRDMPALMASITKIKMLVSVQLRLLGQD